VVGVAQREQTGVDPLGGGGDERCRQGCVGVQTTTNAAGGATVGVGRGRATIIVSAGDTFRSRRVVVR